MKYISTKQFYLVALFSFILIFSRTILLLTLVRETDATETDAMVGAMAMYLLRVATPMVLTGVAYASLIKKISFSNVFGIVFLILFIIEGVYTIIEFEYKVFLYYIIIGAVGAICFLISSIMNKTLNNQQTNNKKH